MTPMLIVGNFIVLTCSGRRVAFNVQNITTVREDVRLTKIFTTDCLDAETCWQVDESFDDVMRAIIGDEP